MLLYFYGGDVAAQKKESNMPTHYHPDNGKMQQISPHACADFCPTCGNLSVHLFANHVCEVESCTRCEFETPPHWFDDEGVSTHD